MTSETTAVVFMVAYVLTGAAGMLPYLHDAINPPPSIPDTGYVRVYDNNIWIRSQGDGYAEIITNNGDKIHLETNKVYHCPPGTHTITGGTVITDTDKILCDMVVDGGTSDADSDGNADDNDYPNGQPCFMTYATDNLGICVTLVER